MGASGALALALLRRRLNLMLLTQAKDSTLRVTSFVIFILVGSRCSASHSGRSTVTCGSSATDELRVLGLLAGGHNAATASAELGVSVEAVSRRGKDIYDRLHVHSMSEAVSRTLRERVGH